MPDFDLPERAPIAYSCGINVAHDVAHTHRFCVNLYGRCFLHLARRVTFRNRYRAPLHLSWHLLISWPSELVRQIYRRDLTPSIPAPPRITALCRTSDHGFEAVHPALSIPRDGSAHANDIDHTSGQNFPTSGNPRYQFPCPTTSFLRPVRRLDHCCSACASFVE